MTTNEMTQCEHCETPLLPYERCAPCDARLIEKLTAENAALRAALEEEREYHLAAVEAAEQLNHRINKRGGFVEIDDQLASSVLYNSALNSLHAVRWELKQARLAHANVNHMATWLLDNLSHPRAWQCAQDIVDASASEMGHTKK